MCGIAGILFKDYRDEGPVGRQLLAMASTLASRGTDSTGMAITRLGQPGALIMVAYLEGLGPADTGGRDREVIDRVGEVAPVEGSRLAGDLLRLVVRDVSEEASTDLLGRLTRAAESVDDVKVFSIGRGMEIIKDVGVAERLNGRHGVGAATGTHGLAHTRLATESRVDVCHSHPFWARPFPDIAVVHNGQLTNHHKLRRQYERRGYEFLTENDSEVIAVYVADRLSQGAALAEALTDSVNALDGTFTYLVSTKDSIGYAKDRFATKPLVVAENDRYVAMASEEVALRPAITPDSVVHEPVAKAVKTWSR